MKVLIIGSGAREHAIGWSFCQSPKVSKLFFAPGNAGTDEIGNNFIDLDPMDFESVIAICKKHGINLVFVGPEAPSASGLVDALYKEKIPTIGPNQKSAQLEASKTFSKQFMVRHNIPTAKAQEIADIQKLKDYLQKTPGKMVIKKSGLAAGKGVFESDNYEELLAFGSKILKDDKLLVEEYLSGWEVSIFAFTDGKDYVIFPPCTDFKKAQEGDMGPNTGGMGSICPVPWVDAALLKKIEKKIVAPTFAGMEKDGLSYTGILYFGLMITDQGPKTLEYNIRLGDPEAQVLLPMIKSDFSNLCQAMVEERLAGEQVEFYDRHALGVVVASDGYPKEYKKGIPVAPIPFLPEDEALIFHASTQKTGQNQVITGGGRCFTVVGLGSDLKIAFNKAYTAVKKINFQGAWYRIDIGKKFIK